MHEVEENQVEDVLSVLLQVDHHLKDQDETLNLERNVLWCLSQ